MYPGQDSLVLYTTTGYHLPATPRVHLPCTAPWLHAGQCTRSVIAAVTRAIAERAVTDEGVTAGQKRRNRARVDFPALKRR